MIEFADRDDPMVSRLLAAKREEVHEGYGREAFERRSARASRSSAASSSARARARSTSPPRDVTRPQALPWWLAGLHLLVLWSFAVAQPLFDLLGKNGEFFAARGSTRWDAIVFALVLLLVPPALLLGLELRLWDGACAGPSTRSSSPALVALFVLQAIRGSGAPGWLLVVAAVALGAAAAELYLRVPAARLALTVLAPAPLLFLALFLFNSDVSRLSLSTETAQAAGERPRAPVVLIAFDELPVNSLLDAHGRIDPVRFPNFARLARGSTWFEHATTVGEGTTHAIPAILTGRFPKAGEFPVYTDHRQNLFTLFGGGAALHVVDHETHLCPPSLCSGLEGSLGHRTTTLAEDTGVVYLHELLPDDLTGGIPSIANGWDDFLQDASKHNDPGQIDPAFLDSLRPGSRPGALVPPPVAPAQPVDVPPVGRALRRSARAGLGLGRGLDVESGRGRPVLAAAPAAARLRRPRARAAARPAPRDRPLRPRRARRHRRPRRQLPRRAEAPAAVGGQPPGHRLRAVVREDAGPANRPHRVEARANDRHPPHARRRDAASGSPGTWTATRSSGRGRPSSRDPRSRTRASAS